jgi:hypothetical protein
METRKSAGLDLADLLPVEGVEMLISKSEMLYWSVSDNEREWEMTSEWLDDGHY